MRYFSSDVATPIAASLGDLTTLGLLAAISTWLFYAISKKTTFAFTLRGLEDWNLNS